MGLIENINENGKFPKLRGKRNKIKLTEEDFNNQIDNVANIFNVMDQKSLGESKIVWGKDYKKLIRHFEHIDAPEKLLFNAQVKKLDLDSMFVMIIPMNEYIDITFSIHDNMNYEQYHDALSILSGVKSITYPLEGGQIEFMCKFCFGALDDDGEVDEESGVGSYGDLDEIGLYFINFIPHAHAKKIASILSNVADYDE